MSNEEIIEGNRLIAIFKGWEQGRFEHLPNKLHKVVDDKLIGINVANLKYHSSLDLLKLAIDAFINLDISIFNYNAVAMSEFRQIRQSLSNMPISKSIDDFWNELVTAIVWYNQNKETDNA